MHDADRRQCRICLHRQAQARHHPTRSAAESADPARPDHRHPVAQGDAVMGVMRLPATRAARAVRSPLPCGEGLGEGVVWGTLVPQATPLPNPPPQGGREQTASSAVVVPVSAGSAGAGSQ